MVAPWISAVIAGGRVSKEPCSVPAAAVVSLTTTRSPPDPIALTGPLKLKSPQDLMDLLILTDPPDPGCRQEVTGLLCPEGPPVPLNLPIAPGAPGRGSQD